MIKAKESGARMVIELNVSVAFHSPLMASAREHLAEVLNSLEISDTISPVFTNVDSNLLMIHSGQIYSNRKNINLTCKSKHHNW